jgi:hydroxypyruvate isomerase
MITRRSLLKSLTAGTAVAALPGTLLAQTADSIEALSVKGDIRQSVSIWCFGRFPLDEFCKICKKLGMVGVDLISEGDWDTMLKNDMIVTMGTGVGGIAKGFNRLENHDELVDGYERLIPIAAAKKVPNLICMSGNREGISDEEGMKNCIIGLKRIAPIAEKHGILVTMELLNSIRDHADYQADRTAWAAEIVRKVGSERIKLLYDIYHMQIMEGDIINTMTKNIQYIGHIHTGGNPGRAEIDETQELYYPAIMQALVAVGYKGFVGQEFVPKQEDKSASLEKCIRICDV